jgi:hypothetical protein
MVTVQQDLLAQYEKAKELVSGIEQAWIAEGKPLLTEGGATGSAIVPHPLVKMLAEARRDVDRFAKPLQTKHRGPAPRAVVASVEAPSASRLKAVKSA